MSYTSHIPGHMPIITGRGGVGDIADVGVTPYSIQGNPVMALIAQLNRFAKKTVNPGGKCGSRNYLPQGALPLVTTLDEKAATTANLIMYDRLNCISDVTLLDFRKMKVVNDALTNPIPWAMANLNDITTQIAQFADSLDLAPAAVGITTRDPKMTPSFPTKTVLLLGGLALAAFFITRRMK